MGHVDTVPGKAQEFPFSHAGMECSQHNWFEPVLTGLE